MPDEQTAAIAATVTTTELSKLGASLPLGIQHGGKLHRDIGIRPWRMKEERELGALHAAAKEANVAEYVSLVLATMCTRLGPHDLAAMDKVEDRRLVINQMFMGDVFYAYMWLRVQSVGKELTLRIKVPGRVDEVKYVADLETTQVITADNYEACTHDYPLKNPFMIRGKLVQTLKLGPMRWAALEADRQLGMANKGHAKAMAIKAAIVGADVYPGHGLQLTETELDELSKRDLEGITTQVDNKSIGPVMSIEDEYEGRPFKVGIDWRYDSFFAVSSE